VGPEVATAFSPWSPARSTPSLPPLLVQPATASKTHTAAACLIA
jgi:hypothetical protein